MAKIPTLADSPRISTDVRAAPTLSPDMASAGSRQAAKLSGQLAEGLGRLRQAQINEAKKANMAKGILAGSRAFSLTGDTLDKEYRGSNYEGYYEDGVKRLTKAKEDIINNSPKDVREALSLSLDQRMLSWEQKLKGREAAYKSEYARSSMLDEINQTGMAAHREWNPLQAKELTSILKAQANNSMHLDDGKRRAVMRKIGDVQDLMVEGVISRGNLSEMNSALNDLKDPNNDVLFQDMDPKSKTRAMERIERKINSKKSEFRSETLLDVRRSKNALKAGTLDINDPKDRMAIDELENKVVMNLDADEAQEALAEIDIYKKVNQVASSNPVDILNMDVEQSAKSQFKGDDRLLEAASQAELITNLNQIKGQRIREFKKAPADYMVKYNQDIASKAINLVSDDAGPADYNSYMNSMDHAFDKAGLPKSDRKYLPSQLVQHYGGNFNKFVESGDYKAATYLIDELDRKTGGDTYRLYDELDIDPKMAVLTEISDPDTRSIVLKNMMSAKEGINPQFKLQSDESDDDINRKLAKSDFYKAMSKIDGGQGSFTLQNSKALLDVARVEYKRAVINGNEDGAEEAAWKAFSKSYEVVENGDYPIPVRVKEGYDSKKVENFVDYFTDSDTDYVEKLGIDLLKSKDGTVLSKEATNQTIAKKGKWIYNKKSDSLRLVVREEDGSLFRVGKQGYMIELPKVMDMWDTIEKENIKKVEKRKALRRSIGSSSPHRILR